MSNKSNTDTLMRQAVRRVMPRPVQPHKDANRYNRKNKHKGRSDE